ncbi:MAG: alpha-amylase family glycosyl hydrolase [Bacteroidales bacterium]|nr:alpha-amylase family glycosyl hydrolase [Bacteroidales bacterium]
MKKIFTLILSLIALTLTASAQIVTTSPAILQESSKNVVLTYHADSPLGNNGLKGVTASDPVYAHIGVVTNKSNGSWKYAPTWGDNSAKYKLNYAGPNTWTLNLGDMRTYFGMTDATEHIQKVALVFRNGTMTKEGKTAAGGDIFVEVHPEGFQMQFTTNAQSTVIGKATSMTFTAVTSQAASITISVNGTSIASGTSKTSLSGTYNFNKTGSYTVTAVAKTSAATITKTINVAYPGASTKGTYPGGVPKMGAVKNSDGSVTFCLAAPGKNSVVLVPSWDDYSVLDKNVMKYQDYNGQRYFFTTVTGLDNNKDYMYYYIVDAQYKVGDPYAHLVLDCYSDRWLDSSIWPSMPKYPYDRFDDVVLAVYNGSRDGNYKFSDFTIPSHDNLVIYEMLFRDFTGTDGEANGEGTIRKAIQKLPYLVSLGVNAVELMPVMEFNGNNSWGYNTNFYMALDKAYGSPDDLKEFVEKCHKAGIAVILDIVFNQSDGLHPWYQMYPIESNPFYNKTAPHAYSVLNDWKQENTLVRQQWKDAIKYWMTAYNVDGFRFDLVKGLGTSYGSNTDAYNSSRVTVMKDLHSAIKAVKPNGIHINENLAGAQEENEMAKDGQLNWANINNNSCQYAMGYASQSSLARFLSSSDSRDAFSTIAYAESHDEERMGYKQITYGTGTAKTDLAVRMKRLGQVAVQMLMTPGPKMIWQFGELGADQTTKNATGNDTDPKTVIWNYLDNADRKALHDTYEALCNLRKDNPELFGAKGSFMQSGVNMDNIATPRILRVTNGNKEIIAFINPRLTTAQYNISATSTKLTKDNAKLVCFSKGLTPTLTGSGNSLSVRMPGNSYAVYATTSVQAGVDDITADDNTATAKAYGMVGEIVIEGTYDNVAVYNMSGVAMPSLQVPAGLYIVNIDGNVTKVVVR